EIFRCEQPTVQQAVLTPDGWTHESQPNPSRMGVFRGGDEQPSSADKGAEQFFGILASEAGELLTSMDRAILNRHMPPRVLADVIDEPMPVRRWMFALPYILEIQPRRLTGFTDSPIDRIEDVRADDYVVY